jgi:hypothetical protein
VDAETRKKLIDQYKDGYRVVAEALVGATDEELDGRPAPASGRRARSCTTWPTAR